MPLASLRRSRAARWLGYVASAAVVAWLLFVALPRVGDVGEAGPLLLTHVRAVDVVVVVVLLAVYVSSHALTLKIALPTLSLPAATLVRLVSGAVTRIVPGGWTAGFGAQATLLRVHGVGMERIGHAAAVTAVYNTLTKLSLPVLGLLAEAVAGTTPGVRTWSVVALSVIGTVVTVGLVWLLGRERLGHWVGRLGERPASALASRARRGPVRRLPQRVIAFQRSTAEALRERPWPMVAAYYPYHLCQVVIVWWGMRVAAGAQGLTVGWPEVLTAFSIGYLLTALPIAPAGLGALDVTVVGILVALGETPAVASAGIVTFRVTTYLLYLPSLAAWPLWYGRFREAREP